MSEKKDDKIKKKVLERVGDSPAEEAKDKPLPDRFIDQCLGDNLMGDASLFAAVHRDRFLYNGNSGNWHRWGEHYWEEDLSNSILAAIGNDVAEQYETRADHFTAEIKKLEKKKDKSEAAIKNKEKQRKGVNGRAYALRGERAPKVLKWVPAVAPGMVVEGDEFDRALHLIACGNGVINMETGECLSGDPADKITLSTSHDWPGDIEAKPEKFIKSTRCSLEAAHDYKGAREKFLNDRYEYLHRFIGAAAHGAQRDRAFMVLFGKHGWNGKGTLMETLLHVLGEYAVPTEPEVLLDSKGFKEAGKPTPQILAMKGRRIIIASETDAGNRFSASAVKRFSGGDTLSGRNPHDIRSTYFKPTHTLFLMTNNLPYADADDRPFWERLHILNFHWSYVDRPTEPFEKPRNPTLEEDLRKEAPEILAWIIQGYFKYLKAGGLNPPEEMILERESYRFRDDTIGQFIEACGKDEVDPTNNVTSFKDIKAVFDPWYAENVSKKPMTPKLLGTLLGKKYEKTTTTGNNIAYIGIELKLEGVFLDD